MKSVCSYEQALFSCPKAGDIMEKIIDKIEDILFDIKWFITESPPPSDELMYFLGFVFGLFVQILFARYFNIWE